MNPAHVGSIAKNRLKMYRMIEMSLLLLKAGLVLWIEDCTVVLSICLFCLFAVCCVSLRKNYNTSTVSLEFYK